MRVPRALLAGAVTLLAVSALPPRAAAEEISPAIYLMVDTSGSMVHSMPDAECNGDGSLEHPHDTGCVSRIFIAKNAMTTVVNGYPEVRWGLARFNQTEGWNVNCAYDNSKAAPNSTTSPCSGANPGSPWEYDINGNPTCVPRTSFYGYAYCHDLPGNDRLCINYDGTCNGADILVALADGNELQILNWMNHQEPFGQWFSATHPTTGDHCWNAGASAFGDCELRGTGGTPLGASLAALYDQISQTDLNNDPLKGCRPYRVILLTDGDESCGGSPAAEAATLRSTPDLSSNCNLDADCPVNATCNTVTHHCEYEVKTTVIGLNTTSALLDSIAASGGTGASIPALNEDDIVAAMADVIADAVHPELCNGADDDCDGLVDEDYPVGQTCNNGLLGVCNADGVYICDPADPTGVVCDVTSPSPSAEVCDGLDNDCDGEVDEDDVCCNGPELCNGVDDYCGHGPVGMSDGDEDPRVFASPGVRRTCGTDVGVCEFGQMFCVGGAPVCQGGTGPDPQELCDAVDHNCNGLTNDVAPEACNITNSNGTCLGVRICELPGQWSSCMGQQPAAEICNGQDENCNGLIDEGLDTPIFCGVGVCFHSVPYCDGGAVQTCDPLQGAVPESCNGLDDDCNGAVDDGLGSTTCGLGVCQHTVPNCLGGVSQTCNPMQGAGPEVCNGLDDNCNGVVDDGLAPRVCYPAPSGCTEVTPGSWSCLGQCQTGTQSCTGGSWGGCLGARTPVPEICDGADNNCNGQIDEGLGSTWCGLGACYHEQQNCVGGNLVVCDPLAGASPETCNGVDDDCDGVKDDGVTRTCYPSATPGCTETPPGSGSFTCVGECATGVEACQQGGTGTWTGVCNGATTPTVEVCDGRDNDCDGTVDDGIARQCYPFGSGCTARADGTGYDCVGVCAAGSQACVVAGTGTWGACTGATGPGVESCNGLDDDCDGLTDEDASGNPISQACQNSNGFGTCVGSRTCTGIPGNLWTTCSAPTPGPEAWADPNVNPAVCDTIDQDCNGIVNDGVPPRNCSITNPFGTCTGTETCTAAGTWVGCTAKTPQAETCNGVDDDCDGLVDEDASGNPLTQECYTGPAGTDRVGVCNRGMRTCTAGGWGPCMGQVLPTPEVCDGLDNDCDGNVDEDASGQPITRACQNSNTYGTCLGSQTCTSMLGNLWTACSAQTPAEEVCDGVDNNCDGVIDGISRACYPFGDGCTPDGLGGFQCEGICWPGIEVCPSLGAPAAGNSFGACQFAVGPATEVCDGLDNDCDGDVDEGADGLPMHRTCYWPGYGPNTGCTAPGDCLGACSEGQQVCGDVNLGEWGACVGEVTPSQEVCDATDNDCDGQIDEADDMPWIGQPCPASQGVCNGIWACENGQQVCQGGATQPGRCNGVDDDCDGLIDEQDELEQDPEYNESCGSDVGACRAGQKECIGGAWVCVGAVGPSQETCDGTDNDCDGLIDWQAECPPLGQTDTFCVEGDCRVECDPASEFPCPAGLECVVRDHEGQSVYVCMPEIGACGGETCPQGWICENDVCVNPCDPNPCDWYQECRSGVCVDVSCSGINQACPAGEFCVDHGCVADPCDPLDCAADGGFCLRDCDGESCTATCQPACLCPPGQRCDAQGACEEDPCFEVSCGAGQRCNPLAGGCETDPCAAVLCAPAERCFEGECIPNPCGMVECPPFFECVVNTTTDATGDPAPLPGCEPNSAYWEPGREGERFLATGGGGCQCDASGGGEGPPILLLLLLGALLGWRRQRALRGQGGAR